MWVKRDYEERKMSSHKNIGILEHFIPKTLKISVSELIYIRLWDKNIRSYFRVINDRANVNGKYYIFLKFFFEDCFGVDIEKKQR